MAYKYFGPNRLSPLCPDADKSQVHFSALGQKKLQRLWQWIESETMVEQEVDMDNWGADEYNRIVTRIKEVEAKKEASKGIVVSDPMKFETFEKWEFYAEDLHTYCRATTDSGGISIVYLLRDEASVTAGNWVDSYDTQEDLYIRCASMKGRWFDADDKVLWSVIERTASKGQGSSLVKSQRDKKIFSGRAIYLILKANSNIEGRIDNQLSIAAAFLKNVTWNGTTKNNHFGTYVQKFKKNLAILDRHGEPWLKRHTITTFLNNMNDPTLVTPITMVRSEMDKYKHSFEKVHTFLEKSLLSDRTQQSIIQAHKRKIAALSGGRGGGGRGRGYYGRGGRDQGRGRGGHGRTDRSKNPGLPGKIDPHKTYSPDELHNKMTQAQAEKLFKKRRELNLRYQPKVISSVEIVDNDKSKDDSKITNDAGTQFGRTGNKKQK